jgi:hypothetical protein
VAQWSDTFAETAFECYPICSYSPHSYNKSRLMLYWSVLKTPGQQPADSSELAAYMSDQSLFRRQQVTD